MPSAYDDAAIDAFIEGCKTEHEAERLAALEPRARAAHCIIARNYYPTRFPVRPNPYAQEHPRTPCLDLPFGSDDFDGVVFVDEM